jgi:hypothetical protein
VLASTTKYLIQLDNTKRTVAIHIDSGGDRKQFTPGTVIKGHFVAQDLHFGIFGLATLPTSMSPNDQRQRLRQPRKPLRRPETLGSSIPPA